MAAEEFAERYGIHVQVTVALLFFTESLMVAFLKAILVFYLRFEGKHTEKSSILTYHLFQMVAYFSAYLNGLVALQSVQISLVILVILYAISSGCLVAAFLSTPGVASAPILFVFFGLGHGALKSAVHRMFKLNLLGSAFAYWCLVLLFGEALFVGILPIYLPLQSQSIVILGLLGTTFLLLLVSVLGSLFDDHSSNDYKLSQVFGATYYGLVRLFVDAEEKLKGKLRSRGAKPVEKLIKQTHWMDQCIGTFPNELVQDLKKKFRLHKFYLSLAGLWVAVEMKYSYWIFSTYLCKRVLTPDLVIYPPQYLAITPIFFLVFGPIFYLIIRPMLSLSFYNNSLRQMCLGAFLLLAGSCLGLRLSALQKDLGTEFYEPGADHQKVRILNAIDCQSGFAYQFNMDPDLKSVYRPRPALDIDRSHGNSTKKVPYKPKSVEMITNVLLPTIEESFLKYANIRFLDSPRKGVVLWDKLTPTDSFTYLMSVDSIIEHSVTLAAYSQCEALSEYILEIPLMNNRSEVNHWLVFMIQSKDGEANTLPFSTMDYTRDSRQRPGFRVFLATDDKQERVDVLRGGKILVTVDETNSSRWQPPSEIVWLNEGDGTNLEIRVMGKKLHFNYSLGTAELVDILVIVQNNGTVIAKLLHALLPITISGAEPIVQYLIIPAGEFLLGIVGLQQILALTPVKLRFHVRVDWYLLLGLSNLLIVTVSQWDYLPLMHHQLSTLCLIVMISFLLIVLMVARY